MARASVTHIGEGRPAVVRKAFQREWPGLQVTFRTDDISNPTDWRIRDHRHAVVVHLGGRMHRLETELDGYGGSTGPALPGEVWTAPAERHYPSHAFGEQIHYALMFLDPAAAEIIRSSAAGHHDFAPLAGTPDDFLHQAARRLMTAAEADDDISGMIAESLSQSICLHLIRAYSPGNSAAPKAKPGPRLDAAATRRLRNFIYDNLCNRITLDQLARLAGMTKHHLLLAFRHAFGRTPAQFVIQQRLRRAQRQLAETRKDITTIALESGFSSHSHLTACCRQHLGCCPSQFKASAANKASASP